MLQGTPLPETGGIISVENVDRLTLVARWGQGNPGEIAYTPDGKYFVVGTTTGIYFYHPLDFSLVHYIETQAAVSHLAISPDSQVVAAVATDQVILYKIADWQVITNISADANSADFSPDGKVLLLARNSDPGYIQLFDASTGKMLSYIHAEAGAWSVTSSPQGEISLPRQVMRPASGL